MAIPPLVFGYSGWSDCLVDQCFVLIRRSIFHGIEPGGGLMGSDVAVAAGVLTFDPATPRPDRPSITVDTPGPHRAGDAVTATVAGLPEGTTTGISACHVEDPWSCGLLDPVALADGEHTLRLPDTVDRCRPRQCYLQVNSQSEGLAPLATVALDTPG